MLDNAARKKENSRWLVDGVDLADRVAEVPNRATTCRVCDSDSQNDNGFARQTGTMAVCPLSPLRPVPIHTQLPQHKLCDLHGVESSSF